MLKILALDLGTKTGIASNHEGLPPVARTFILAAPGEVTAWGKERLTRRRDPRIFRLFKHLQETDKPDLVVFEDVEFSTYTKQTQLWSSFRTVVWLAFPDTLIECVPVTTLKKFATGSGAADKAMMRKALFRQYPGNSPTIDDNAIDALWILHWAEHNLGRIKT